MQPGGGIFPSMAFLRSASLPAANSLSKTLLLLAALLLLVGRLSPLPLPLLLRWVLLYAAASSWYFDLRREQHGRPGHHGTTAWCFFIILHM